MARIFAAVAAVFTAVVGNSLQVPFFKPDPDSIRRVGTAGTNKIVTFYNTIYRGIFKPVLATEHYNDQFYRIVDPIVQRGLESATDLRVDLEEQLADSLLSSDRKLKLAIDTVWRLLSELGDILTKVFGAFDAYWGSAEGAETLKLRLAGNAALAGIVFDTYVVEAIYLVHDAYSTPLTGTCAKLAFTASLAHGLYEQFDNAIIPTPYEAVNDVVERYYAMACDSRRKADQHVAEYKFFWSTKMDFGIYENLRKRLQGLAEPFLRINGAQIEER
ncbi:undecaprenyl-phosphate glucose phosphotransferase [Babesia caballi]|uniref:Undecaprenyl-phosphate glucose phosphotransferase n=1 Tax=Babesia caballi TaxID=5871 RepID=A0AAV4M2P3_BABCB|nr:undecaprenyl-phosphate glucose phosphotransferase [Babesia caballi]